MPFAFEGDASGGSGARGYFTAYNPSKTLNPKIDIAATSVDPSKSSRSVSTHSFIHKLRQGICLPNIHTHSCTHSDDHRSTLCMVMTVLNAVGRDGSGRRAVSKKMRRKQNAFMRMRRRASARWGLK